MEELKLKDKQFIGMVVAGGLENAGGIGRVIGYILSYWNKTEAPMPIRLFDPRGSGNIALFPLFLLKTMLEILWFRITGRLALLHINLASKGSTLRKIILVAWSKLLGVPYIIHLHGAKFHIFFAGLPFPFRCLIKGMFQKAEKTIVLGDNWKSFLVDEVGVDPNKVVVIPNGVPAPTLPKQKSDEPHIVFLGRLGVRKGVPELLSALASPDMKPLKWRATIAGDGAVDVYKEEAIRLGIKERIEFPGWVDETAVKTILASADILALPSYAEGLPIAVLEALSHGLAVVTTPVGALPELLTNGEDSLLVPVGDAERLKDALKSLVEDQALREKMGQKSFALFEKRIDISIAANRIKTLYEKIIQS